MGTKTAERVMLELRTISKGFISTQVLPASHLMQIVSDSVKALVSLGCSREQAEKAVEAALKELGPNADAETLFRRALAIR